MSRLDPSKHFFTERMCVLCNNQDVFLCLVPSPAILLRTYINRHPMQRYCKAISGLLCAIRFVCRAACQRAKAGEAIDVLTRDYVDVLQQNIDMNLVGETLAAF